MWNRNRMMILAVAGAALQLSTPAGISTAGEVKAVMKKDRPAHVQAIDGSNEKLVILNEKAAKRLDIQTGEVSNAEGGGLIAPYSSIVYDTAGGTWVYTSPKALTFHRRSVVIETIKGGKAYLKEGPPPGTSVVTVGVAELYGTEKGLGH